MPLNRLGFTKSTLFFAGIYATPHTFSTLLHHPSATAPTKNFSIKRFQTAASQFPDLMIPFKLFDSVDFQLCRVPYFPLYDCFMIIFHILLCQFSIVLFQLFRKKIPDIILLHKQISLVLFILKDANDRNRSPTRFAMHHSFAVTYAHLSLESLLFPCFQAFFIFKFRHILLAFCIVLWCNKYYTKRSACYVPQKNTKPEWSDSPFHC